MPTGLPEAVKFSLFKVIFKVNLNGKLGLMHTSPYLYIFGSSSSYLNN